VGSIPKVTIRPFGRYRGGEPAGLLELVGLADHVIGGEHQRERVALTL
jgi:hypothetical protein